MRENLNVKVIKGVLLTIWGINATGGHKKGTAVVLAPENKSD